MVMSPAHTCKNIIFSIIFNILFLIFPFPAMAYTTNMNASVVIGQADFKSNLTNQTGSTTMAGANTLRQPYGVFTDGTRLFIADYANNRVLIYNKIPTSNNASADIVLGQTDFTTVTSGTTDSKFNQPLDVFYDGRRLFIAESYGPGGNHRVLIYNQLPTRNGQAADVVVGQTDFTTATTGLTASKFGTYLINIAVCGNKLFISDEGNSRVLIFNSIPTTNGASADVVIGQTDFNTSSSACSATKLMYPHHLFCDGTKLFIPDAGNNRVLIYNSIPTTNGASADVVVGQPNFTSCDGNQGGGTTTAGPNTLQYPRSVYSDGKRLFIGDPNSRVLVFNSIPTSNNASADVVIGQPDFSSRNVNQGGSVGANTQNNTSIIMTYGLRLFVSDWLNNRVLIYGDLTSNLIILTINLNNSPTEEQSTTSYRSINFTVNSTMPKKDVAANSDNQIQIRLANGMIIPLAYQTTEDEQTVWTGKYNLPLGVTNLTPLKGTVEAIAYDITTDVVTHFITTLPPGFNNTGVVLNFDIPDASPGAYTIDNSSPSAVLKFIPSQIEKKEENILSTASELIRGLISNLFTKINNIKSSLNFSF